MLISTLQQFIRLLAPPLAAAGLNASSQKSVTGSLESLADALEPFAKMDSLQMAELLTIAHEYRQADKLPDWVMSRQPKPGKARTPAAPKPPKMTAEQAVGRLREFQDRSSILDPEAIEREMEAISVLTTPQLKEVQKDFLGAVLGKTKGEMLAAIRKKLDNHQSSQDRINTMFSN